MRKDMAMTQLITIDGNEINSEHDFHFILSSLLDFGPYYGNNTDALWDMLSSGMGAGVILHWKNSNISRQKLGAVFDIIIYVFNKTKNKYQGKGEEREFDFILE